jgi:transposase
MRKDLKRQKQRLMQFLLRLGKKYPTSNRYWTGIFHRWIKTLTFDEDIHREVFNEYYTVILEQEAKIARLTERIEEISAETRYAERVSKLKCLKGISTLSALTFVVEIGDFRRFRKAQGFMAYMGLVPSEHSSGEIRKQGRITKAGNSRLRMLLIEAGWHYRHYGPSKRLSQRRKGQSVDIVAYADKAGKRLNRKFDRLSLRGKTKQKIVTAVARELAGFIWGMMVGRTELA